MRIILILIFSLFMAIGFGQEKTVYSVIADSLLATERYEEMISYFENENLKHPNNEEILSCLGYSYSISNNLILGEAYYRKALAVNPSCTKCLMNIGRIYSMKGDNVQALDYFDKAIIVDSMDAQLFAERALLKEMSHDNFGALIDLDKAIGKDPNNEKYYNQRGLCNSRLGYFSSAIQDMNKVVALLPNDYNSYFQRARVYCEQNKFDKAIVDFNQALKLDGTQTSVLNSRGAAYDFLAEHRLAINDYSRAIDLNNEDYLPFLNRANAYYKLENMDSSCLDYAVLLQMVKDEAITNESLIENINAAIFGFCDITKAGYYYQRGIAYFNLNDFRKALEIYNIGLERFPEHAMMNSFKGNAYMMLYEFENAILNYNLALKFVGNLPAELKENHNYRNRDEENKVFYSGFLATTYFSLAECAFYLNRLDQALVDINKAIQYAEDRREIDLEEYYNLRGVILGKKGLYEEALADFDKSIFINYKFSMAYLNRAVAKVSMIRQPKLISFSVRTGFNTQLKPINWGGPQKSTLTKNEALFLSALADCNTAIGIDKSNGFSFYIRGLIKQLLMYDDYCDDFNNATDLGFLVDKNLLKNCLK